MHGYTAVYSTLLLKGQAKDTEGVLVRLVTVNGATHLLAKYIGAIRYNVSFQKDNPLGH